MTGSTADTSEGRSAGQHFDWAMQRARETLEVAGDTRAVLDAATDLICDLDEHPDTRGLVAHVALATLTVRTVRHMRSVLAQLVRCRPRD